MRKIKFRAWDPIEKRMYYDNAVVAYGLAWLEEESFDNDAIRLKKDGHELVSMQFTGLHDKSGKEIYEGDIIGSYEGEEIGWLKSKVGWWDDNARFHLQNNEGYSTDEDIDPRDWVRLEVIGNIYENPELLN